MMKMLLFYLSLILVSAVLLNAQPYEAGDMIGDFSASICANGEGNLNLYDYYGDFNGGDYNVIWLTFFASW